VTFTDKTPYPYCSLLPTAVPVPPDDEDWDLGGLVVALWLEVEGGTVVVGVGCTGPEEAMPRVVGAEPTACIPTIPAKPAALATTTAGARLI
jgi:hypothetical protein